MPHLAFTFAEFAMRIHLNRSGDTNASFRIRIRRIRRIRNAPRSIRHPSAAIVAAGLQVHVAAHLGDASSKGLPGWDIREPELPRGEPKSKQRAPNCTGPFSCFGAVKALLFKQEYELGNANLLCIASEHFGCQNGRASPKYRVPVHHPVNRYRRTPKNATSTCRNQP